MDYLNIITAFIFVVLVFVGGLYFTDNFPNKYPALTSFYTVVKTKFRMFITRLADHLDGTPDGRWDRKAAITKIENIFHQQLDNLSTELRIKLNHVLEEFKQDVISGAAVKDDLALQKAMDNALEKIKVIAKSQTDEIIADAKSKLTEEANAIKDIAVDTAKEPTK